MSDICVAYAISHLMIARNKVSCSLTLLLLYSENKVLRVVTVLLCYNSFLTWKVVGASVFRRGGGGCDHDSKIPSYGLALS